MSVNESDYSSDGFGWESDESHYRSGQRMPNTREVAYNRANRVNIQRNLVPDYRDFMEIQRQLEARYPYRGGSRTGGLFTTNGGPFRPQSRIPRWIIYHVWETQRDRLLQTGRYPRERAMVDYYSSLNEYPPWFQSLNARERAAFLGAREQGIVPTGGFSLDQLAEENTLDMGDYT